ncbi:PspC domain-containing protein [Arthrobacter russicus]|jgi:phage shock protein C|uniref:Phage shock protein PspC (Stress-responsive transcriptional regulator) n=1 Tax=Arthrobacter russicus TaxID=172040 RepID=A0ABU1JE20_9MICC|nr:PspC domain-containing protein [Arthrobacter russicus]MBQ1444626.1 PspC domain-containing protein [Renibacterium sp.]MDN5668731.1 PspC domain-containing protein [Renibacterium salmoninarum]MDR6270389.1 phage shock protein PspC (stress-responsive transcriptional regulator) [Arthrobacter russicus]
MESFYRTMRSQRLRRGPKRLLGGVLGGLAAAMNIDVAWVRIGFLLFCLLPGPAFLLYLAAWAIVPDQDGGIVIAKLLARKRA